MRSVERSLRRHFAHRARVVEAELREQYGLDRAKTIALLHVRPRIDPHGASREEIEADDARHTVEWNKSQVIWDATIDFDRKDRVGKKLLRRLKRIGRLRKHKGDFERITGEQTSMAPSGVSLGLAHLGNAVLGPLGYTPHVKGIFAPGYEEYTGRFRLQGFPPDTIVDRHAYRNRAEKRRRPKPYHSNDIANRL